MFNFIRNLLKPKVIVELTMPESKMPFYGSEFAAGADLVAAQDMVIPAKSSRLIKTGIKMKLPRGRYMSIESRSGLSVKFQLEKGAGIIDEDYRGEIGVVLYNHGYASYMVKTGDRIAQGIIQKYEQAKFIPGVVDADTKRAGGGFGSTGHSVGS